MKKGLVVVLLLVLAGCSSAPRLSSAERLALYREHAGEPVRSFRLVGQLNGWSPLGDETVVVWTRPKEAWLLDLYGPCHDLEYASAISLSSLGSTVHARTDTVMPIGSMVGQVGRMPCRIEHIRPLDTRGLKQAQDELREVQAAERAATAPPTP